MFLASLIKTLVSFGFTVTIAPANLHDNMQDAVQYWNQQENKTYPCFVVETVDIGKINACQSSANSVNIVLVN